MSCDSVSLENNLTELCKSLSKLDYNTIANVDSLPDNKLKLNSCDSSYAFLYSAVAPYEMIRYPYRSYDNKVLQIQGRSNFIQKITEASLKSTRASSISIDYGPADLNLKKNYLVYACQINLSSNKLMIATSFLSSADKKFLSANLFTAPNDVAEKKLYAIVASPTSTASDRALGITQLYEKSVAESKKELLAKLDISEEIIQSVLLNSFHKEKIVDFVLSKMQKNENQNIKDIKGSIESYLEKSLFANTNLAMLIKLQNENKALSVESATLAGKLKIANDEAQSSKEQLNTVKKSQLILWENNNYTYAVVSAIFLLLISTILGVALYRK